MYVVICESSNYDHEGKIFVYTADHEVDEDWEFDEFVRNEEPDEYYFAEDDGDIEYDHECYYDGEIDDSGFDDDDEDWDDDDDWDIDEDENYLHILEQVEVPDDATEYEYKGQKFDLTKAKKIEGYEE